MIELDPASLGSPTLISGTTSNGSITVRPGDSDKVHLVAHLTAYGTTQEAADELLTKIDPTIDYVSGKLTINAVPKETFASLSISLELEVPSDSMLKLMSSNGGIEAKNIMNAIECETSNGSIHVSGAKNSVQAKSSNGRIEVRNSEGAISARTSNGRIELIGCQLTGASEIRTSNGSIEAQLLPGYPIEIEAATSNGSINSALMLDQQSKAKSRLSGIVFGAAGMEPVKLKLTTSNGSITLKGSATEKASEELASPSVQ